MSRSRAIMVSQILFVVLDSYLVFLCQLSMQKGLVKKNYLELYNLFASFLLLIKEAVVCLCMKMAHSF